MARSEVVIIIDALGYDIARRHLFSPAGLGRAVRVKTVFGFSQAALTTILTGLDPAAHGLWMMYSFGGDEFPFAWLRYLPAFASSDRLWVRKLLNWKLAHIDGISAYYNLYDVPRKVLCHLDLPARKRLFSIDSVKGCRTVIDRAVAGDVPLFIRDYHTREDRAFDELNGALSREKAGYYLLYTAGLDSTMHKYGTDHEETARHLAWYEGRISALLSAYPGIKFTVLGDHGMADVRNHVDIAALIEPLGLKVPVEYIPFYDSTMARFRIKDAVCENKLRGALSKVKAGRFVEAEEMKDLGIRFDDGRFGDLIFIMDEGNIILPSFMGKDPVAAMHGYHPETSSMFSALFANYVLPRDQFELTDVAGFIAPRFNILGETP